MGKIIDRLLKDQPEKRLEYIAIKKLEDPEEIRAFFEEYKEWLPKYLPEEVVKGRSLESIISTNLGYIIGYLDPDDRKKWYDIIGPMHPVYGRC